MRVVHHVSKTFNITDTAVRWCYTDCSTWRTPRWQWLFSGTGEELRAELLKFYKTQQQVNDVYGDPVRVHEVSTENRDVTCLLCIAVGK